MPNSTPKTHEKDPTAQTTRNLDRVNARTITAFDRQLAATQQSISHLYTTYEHAAKQNPSERLNLITTLTSLARYQRNVTRNLAKIYRADETAILGNVPT